MATVADLLSLLDDKLFSYSTALDLPGGADGQARKIRALNAGKHKVWQVLVAASRPERASWFAKSDSVTINLGTRSAALPADFHDMLFVESSTVKMIGSHWAKDTWRDARKEPANLDMTTAPQQLYVVRGDNPAVLEVGRKPAANLSVTINYTSILPEWTASGDSIDRVPAPYFDAICNYAAMVLCATMQDSETSREWRLAWADDMNIIPAAAGERSSGQNLVQEGFDPQS